MSIPTEPHSRAYSEDDSEGTTDDAALNQGYKSIFQSHLTQTLRHSTGYFSASMGASNFPPSAYWTAEEKDLFFHALTRHSTLRPDLIAAEIGSKTVVDVCGYIALLRNAQKSETEVSPYNLPAALEMSDKWIEFEEKQAFVLIDAAAGWEADQKEKDRKEILRNIKGRKKSVKGAVVNRTWDVRVEETIRLRLYEERKAEMEAVWEKEDALEVLGAIELETMDAVVRKGIEGQEMETGLDIATASPILQVDGGDGLDLASLTPTERRRVKNRLYMRRKRAQATGNALDGSIMRLKPGREPKAVPRESTSVRQRGMTRAEKAAVKFTKYELDFKRLKEHELDLFHLRRFGGLMFAYSHGNLENIKYSVIRLLRAYLDEWLSIVVQHAVLAAEQERRAKEHTRAWKTNLGEIKVRHVEHTLAVLGYKHSKRALLEQLERRIGESESKGDEDMEDNRPETLSCRVSEVYTPLINHPCLLDPEFELNKPPNDDIMDPPTRLDAFLDTEQDEMLENIDAHRAKRHERMLWRLVGKEDEIESDGSSNEQEDDMGDYEMTERRLTLRQKRGLPNWMFQRTGGAIKSEPFVNTSDEESASE